MPVREKIEIPVAGMDCTECTQHVEHAIQALPGVASVRVSLAAEKAAIQYDPARVDLGMIRRAVQSAGYQVPEPAPEKTSDEPSRSIQDVSRPIFTYLGILFGLILFIVVFGEWLGFLERITDAVPWPVGWAIVLLFGYPVFKNVVQASLRRQVISHTLMTVGVVAALAVGEWATAAVVVFFMRVGDYTEKFTTDRARQAVRDLTRMAPQTARVEREGQEIELELAGVRVGDIVIVRPGEKIPVDGEVIQGQAAIDQAAITGESLPVDAGPGSRVYAATIAQLGSLRILARQIGSDTTFGKVIRMVEDAEEHRAEIQRVGDRFAAYYLPVVAGIAALTFAFSRNPMSTAAVLLVACSCSFTLATPIAVLASIGAGARRGLLIKGGRYLELLAKADCVLIDKTGTLTLGKARLTDVIPLDGASPAELLSLAASVERDSEHPLAECIRQAGKQQGLDLSPVQEFEAMPGFGVRARIGSETVEVGSWRVLSGQPAPAAALALEKEGKTALYVRRNGALVGVLAVADTLRPEAPQALEELRSLGIRQIELLTGDNEPVAAALASRLGIAYRANLLPEDKIAIVKDYQRQGKTVVMVGDGVNDAPALAQAQVGIAMGSAGSDVAVEAASIVILRDDWTLLPQVYRMARRTLSTIRANLAFTILYNIVGITLAALGLLPPVLAAAAQSLPDLGILGNSSRLLRQK